MAGLRRKGDPIFPEDEPKPFQRKHPDANCEECPLYGPGRFVPTKHPSGSNSRVGSGDHVRSRMVFIGEAPGNTEIARGEPFVGPSGKLLGLALEQYGVTREEVTLTNACLCHYPQYMKKIPKEAIEACRPRLLKEIEESGAPVVLPLGNSAIQSIFPKDQAKAGITQLRAGGPKHSPWLPEGVTAVPTFHPAACLRSQEKWPRMLGDIGKAADPRNLPTAWYEPMVEVITKDDSDYLEILDELVDSYAGTNRIIFLDIETSREKDVSYGNVHMNNLLCVGVGAEDSDIVYVFADDCFTSPAFRLEFLRLLDKCILGAQNGKFDLGSLRAFLGGYGTYEAPVLSEDTMLQSYMLFEYGGVHGLEYMGMEVLGTPDWKHDLDPYLKGPDGRGETDYGNVPRDILYKYNARDVHATRLLRKHYSPLLEQEGLNRGYEFLIRASNALTLIEPRGIGFDLHNSQEYSTELQAEKRQLEEKLPTVSDPTAKSKKLREPHRLNPDSPNQVQRYFQDNGLSVENTEADTLREFLPRSSVPIEVRETIQTILDIRGITKLDGTFVSGMAKRITPEGTVNPSFLLHGTTSGRLSARNPNSQNIPRAKRVKKQFVARKPGNVMVGVDMAQAELRVLCWLAQDEGLREIFNDPDRDLFVELSRVMFPAMMRGLSFSEVKAHPIRPKLKGAVYGLAYGRTAGGLSSDRTLGLSFAEAQDILDKLSTAIPGVIEYLNSVAKQALDPEAPALETVFGRKRRFHLVTSYNAHEIANEARSFPAQSVASDIVLEAACRLTLDPELQTFIVNLVHDAIYADVLEQEAQETADRLSRVMIQVAEEVTEGYVRFATDAKIGWSWADV